MTFEKSWQSEVPGEEKKVNTVPIFKKLRENPVNYQPISLTSVPVKTMEQILLEAVLRHMDNRKAIWDNQHGLAKGKSCLTKLVAFYDGVTNSADKGGATDDIYLGFCKAFDKSPITSVSPNWREMDAMEKPIDGQGIGWTSTFRG